MLPIPSRMLELVVYDSARVVTGDATFALNFNTSRDGATTIDLDPSAVPRFWFVIDLAIARDNAVALFGPPPQELIVAPRDDEVRAALLESTRWYCRHGGDADATLLAASRAWNSMNTGHWASKSAAAQWASERLAATDLELAKAVAMAVGARAGERAHNADVHAHAIRLVDRVVATIG